MKKIYKVLVIIFLAVALLWVAKDLLYKNNKTISLPDLKEQLGQNFVVGIEGKTLDEKTKQILEKIKPSGVILYYRNFQNPEQFKELILQLQQLATKTTGHPYFIMIDEEPGGATRLDLFKNVFTFGVPDWPQIENDIKIMHSVGINVDLAPIADFAFNDNAFIKDRIPAHNIENLKDFNKKFIALLSKNNVLSTLKHFPGMGVFAEDAHKVLLTTNADNSIINKSVDIFESGVNNGADFVMTCHCMYDALDPENPATTSKKITTDILRNKVGFTGIIITDDLSEMPFTINKKVNLSEATAKALLAGNNLVLFSHKLTETEIIFDKLFSLVENNQDLKTLVSQNYSKIISFKNNKLK